MSALIAMAARAEALAVASIARMRVGTVASSTGTALDHTRASQVEQFRSAEPSLAAAQRGGCARQR